MDQPDYRRTSNSLQTNPPSRHPSNASIPCNSSSRHSSFNSLFDEPLTRHPSIFGTLSSITEDLESLNFNKNTNNNAHSGSAPNTKSLDTLNPSMQNMNVNNKGATPKNNSGSANDSIQQKSLPKKVPLIYRAARCHNAGRCCCGDVQLQVQNDRSGNDDSCDSGAWSDEQKRARGEIP
jgi:hypothetical protein